MLWLDCFEIRPALFLSKCLSEYGLMSLILALLSIDIIHLTALSALPEEGLVFVSFFKLLLFCLLHLALGPLFQLVCQRHGQVLLPQLELSLQLVVVRQLTEERFVGVRCLTDFLQLAIHAVHDLFALFAGHAIEVKVLLAHTLFFPFKECLRCHIHKCQAEGLLSELFWVSEIVVVLLDVVGRLDFFLKFFWAQWLIGS